MSTLTIPTPFRPYADGVSSLEIQSEYVGEAIKELVTQFPSLRQHLYAENGKIQPYVNLFINGEDVRYLQGADTPLLATDQLRIVPSIAGGKRIGRVDQNALKANQAMIVLLSVLAFLSNLPILIVFVAVIMILGTLTRKPGFDFIYKKALIPLKLLKTNIIEDDPAAHRFAQAVGVLFLAFALISFFFSQYALGWVFTWIVIALAFINLVSGFCLGCTIYFWAQRKNQKSESALPGS